MFPNTKYKSEKAFPNEDVCINHFRDLRWPKAHEIECPKCGVIGHHYRLADNTHKCRDCRRKFTVRNGTIFEDSKIPLRTWFIAIFLMTSHKKGISSCQLARDIGVTQKTAWFILHRIRNAAATKAFKAFREYVRGDVTTNRIEGVFGHFKRAVTGVYHQISDQHLDRYLQMFAYRWNRREMTEAGRVNDLLRATKGRKLTYKTLIH